MKSINFKITNSDISTFVANVEGTDRNVKEYVKLPLCANKANLISFDLFKGTCRVHTINLVYAHVNVNKFADEFRRYWYYVQRDGIETAYEPYSAITSEMMKDKTEEEKAALEIIRTRYDSAMETLKDFTTKDVSLIGWTVKTFVHALMKSSDDKFSEEIRNDCSALMKSIKAVEPVKSDKDKINLKDVREKADVLCGHVFKSDDSNGTCEEFTFHCNHKLASDIYRIAYAGRKHNKDGAVIQTTAKSNKVICEIVLACMQALNEKAQSQEEKKTA